jgi:hypothetical protein
MLNWRWPLLNNRRSVEEIAVGQSGFGVSDRCIEELNHNFFFRQVMNVASLLRCPDALDFN